MGLIISDMGPGGAQRVLSHILNHWRGPYTPVLIYINSESQEFYDIPEYIERIYLPSAKLWESNKYISNFYKIYKLRRLIVNKKINLCMSFIGSTNILFLLASIRLPIKKIISERNDPKRQSIGKIWDYLRIKTYPYADLVTANSKGAIHTLKKICSRAKINLLT